MEDMWKKTLFLPFCLLCEFCVFAFCTDLWCFALFWISLTICVCQFTLEDTVKEGVVSSTPPTSSRLSSHNPTTNPNNLATSSHPSPAEQRRTSRLEAARYWISRQFPSWKQPKKTRRWMFQCLLDKRCCRSHALHHQGEFLLFIIQFVALIGAASAIRATQCRLQNSI